jgi:hypothetical protein
LVTKAVIASTEIGIRNPHWDTISGLHLCFDCSLHVWGDIVGLWPQDTYPELGKRE